MPRVQVPLKKAKARLVRADFSLNEIRRDAMQVKLFLASGATEINAIESEINKWLGLLTTDVEVQARQFCVRGHCAE